MLGGLKAGRKEGGNIYWAPYIKLGSVLDVSVRVLHLGLMVAHAEPGSERLRDQPKIGQPLGDQSGLDPGLTQEVREDHPAPLVPLV